MMRRSCCKKCRSRPVSRILFPRLAPASPASRRRDDHSSSPGIADGVEQPTRRLRAGRPIGPVAIRAGAPASPYLVLLRAGFCLPLLLPEARCALTAPFHPYPPTKADSTPFSHRLKTRPVPLFEGRYIFCATGPSGCPARELPGALPCGVRTFLSRGHFVLAERLPTAAVIRPTATVHYRTGAVRCPVSGPVAVPASGRRFRVSGSSALLEHLSIRLLRDLVLLELLVKVASRRVDDFRGLRDVPAILAQLVDEKRALRSRT